MKTWQGLMVMVASNVAGILLALLIAIGSWAIWGEALLSSWGGVVALAGVSAAIVCGVNILVIRYTLLLPLQTLYRRLKEPTPPERSHTAKGVQEIMLLENALNTLRMRRNENLRAGQKFLEDGTLPGFQTLTHDDISENLILRFIQTLELVKAYVEVLIEGHLYMDIPEDIRQTGVGRALYVMTTELRTIITEIRKETTRLSMSSARVAALSQRGSRNAITETHAVENISTSIHQVAGNLREVLQNITRQAGSLDETFTDIQDLLTSTERINTNVEMLSASAEATSRSIHEIHEFMQEIDNHAHSLANISATISTEAGDGGQAVGKVIDGIHTIKQTVEEAAIAIRRLGEDSKHIDEIVEVINKVAEQTNLLALNAAIIAAQAGERGRGFSVVADEIKELSERTRTSTQEISQIIRSLQSGVEQGTVAMQRCLQAVGDGVDLSNQSGDILQKIVLSIQGAQEMAANLAEATVKQTQNSQQVHHATEQIMQKIGELSATASKQADDSTHLAEMANILKDVTQQIELSATTQLQASDAIVLSIEEIQDMVQRNAKIAHELATSSEELAALESNLAESMGNFLITPPPLPSDFDETCPTVVFIFPGAPSFYGYIYKGIKKILTPQGFQALAMDAQNDAIIQAEYVNWSLRQPWLKGIILCAFDEQTGGRIVLDAREAGIPVVVADRSSQNAMISVFSNNKQGGEYAAEILHTRLLDDQPQTVLACGPRNIHSIFNRMEGFFSKARSYNWKVGEVFTSIMNIEEAQQSLLEGLRMQPDTKGLFLTNEHASQAYLELLQHGKLAKRNLYAICYDLNRDIAQAIRDDRILGTLFQDPEQIGQVAAQALWDQLQPAAEAPTAPQELFVPVKKITRDNLDAFLSFLNNNHQEE